MAETSQKKITLSNFFEQIVEINKISQKALERSNESVSISEKTRIDLEKLIATLKISFDRELQNVEAQTSNQVTNVLNRSSNTQITNLIRENKSQNNQISSLIREDATEDQELRNSFTQLQGSFGELSTAISIIRKDLDNLTSSLLQMQQGRRAMLKSRDRDITKQEDTIQKEQILGTGKKQEKQQSEYQKRSQEQKENKALNALKGLLGGGLLTGLGMAFGGGDPAIDDPTSPSGGAPTSDSQKEVAKIMGAEFASKGLSQDGVNLALAEIGRENSLNRNTILGTHDDNGVTAYGAVSWQGGREKVLMDELKARGIEPTVEGLKGSGDEGLRANAAAMIKEIESRGHTELLTLLKKPNLTDQEKERARQLFKDEYFVYNKSVPLQESRNWYDTVTKMGVQPSSKMGGLGSEYKAQEMEQMRKYYESKGLPIPEYLQPVSPETSTKLSPQSYISPEQRTGVPELTKPMSQNVASLTLPAINAGSQSVAGGQGRGQASTQNYTVSSASNTMTFARVLTSSFSDKMNITVG